MTFKAAMAIAQRDSSLIAAASRGVVPQDSPLLVTADSAYVVYRPQGTSLVKDLIGISFIRTNGVWQVNYIGFQERR